MERERKRGRRKKAIESVVETKRKVSGLEAEKQQGYL